MEIKHHHRALSDDIVKLEYRLAHIVGGVFAALERALGKAHSPVCAARPDCVFFGVVAVVAIPYIDHIKRSVEPHADAPYQMDSVFAVADFYIRYLGPLKVAELHSRGVCPCVGVKFALIGGVIFLPRFKPVFIVEMYCFIDIHISAVVGIEPLVKHCALDGVNRCHLVALIHIVFTHRACCEGCGAYSPFRRLHKRCRDRA